MKRLYPFLLVGILSACQQDQAEPLEVKATIRGFALGVGACMGGYSIQLDSGDYRSVSALPAPYQDENKITYPAAVWIRYKPDSSCGGIRDLIIVTSIRKRRL